MKRRILTLSTALILLLVATAAQALTPIHRSSVRYGSTGIDGGYAVAIDASGNVLVAGTFSGTVNLGGANLVSNGIYDIFLAKFNSAGAHQWSQKFGGTSFDDPHSIAVDAAGNVYMTGTFTNTVNFGGANLVSAGASDIFLAKYNSAGVHQWSERFGSTDFDVGMSIAVDNSGLYFTGYFRGDVNFGGGLFSSLGLEDIILAKYETAFGGQMWSISYGDTGSDLGYSVAVTPSGNLCLTGSFEGTMNFFGGPILTSDGSSDVCVGLFEPDGDHIWSFRAGGGSADFGMAVAADGSNHVAVTGGFSGTANFGGGNFTAAGSGYDVFVARYDAGGNHLWSHSAGGTGNDAPQTIALDATGNIYIGGFYTGNATFGFDNLVGAGAPDMFLARYGANGVYHWSKGFGSASSDVARGVAIDNAKNVVMVGDFQNSINFGGGSLMSAGSSDAVIVKYDQYTTEPLITSIRDIGNDQGRKVKIDFDRSGVDAAAAGTPVTRYVAFRKDKAAPSGLVAGDGGPQLAPGWIEVGSVGAFAEDSYSMEVSTIGDSTVAAGPYNSIFYIRAATNLPATFYDSRPDSGYSLDNLAPGVPLNLVYAAGYLTWDAIDDESIDHFTVYGSNTDAFGAATLVDYSVSPAVDVTASPYVYYYVTATDFSGNEGKPAKVNTLTGAGGTPSRYVLSVSNYPNPFNPRTTVSYTVPSRGAVTVAVYDIHGAYVATLFRGERATGAYSIEWDGRDARGVGVGSGVYFARIEHASGVRSKKMVLLK